jgi:CBS-domain-containing membrane protein
MLDLIRRMAHAGIDRCPVVDEEGRVAGFLSPNDIVRTRLRSYAP